jgi:hypothetical protein
MKKKYQKKVKEIFVPHNKNKKYENLKKKN